MASVYNLYSQMEKEANDVSVELPKSVIQFMETIHKYKTSQEFYSQLENESTQVEELPEMFTSVESRKKYIQEELKGQPYYKGYKKEGVIREFPLLQKRFDSINSRALSKYSRKDRENIKNKKIQSKHINFVYAREAQLLGQFMRFTHDAYKRDPKFKNYDYKFKFEWFLDINRVKPFFEFFEELDKGSNTCRNDALKYRNFLSYIMQYNACMPYLASIFLLGNWLGSYSEVHKDRNNRGEGKTQKKNANQLIKDGQMMNIEEYKTFLKWIIHQLNSMIKKWKEKLVGQYKDNWSKYIPKHEARKFQKFLFTGVMAFSGGLRKEVISLLRVDKLVRENSCIGTELSNEKTPRSNSNSIPLAKEFEMYIRFFIANVRNSLFTKNTPKGILSLWININGLPLEKKNFTEIVRSVIAKFNPVLNITPIQFRRFNVTMVFQGLVVPKEELEDFLDMFSKLLNVSKEVMKKYYNRFNAHADMITALQKLQQPFKDEEFQLMCTEGIDLFSNTPEFKVVDVPDVDSHDIKRPVRLTYDDSEWLMVLKEMNDNWLKFVPWKFGKVVKEVNIYIEKLRELGAKISENYGRKKCKKKGKRKRNSRDEEYRTKKRIKKIKTENNTKQNQDDNGKLQYEDFKEIKVIDNDEIEELLDVKKIDGKFYYLATWKRSDRTTWVEECDTGFPIHLLDLLKKKKNLIGSDEMKIDEQVNEDQTADYDQIYIDLTDEFEEIPNDQSTEQDTEHTQQLYDQIKQLGQQNSDLKRQLIEKEEFYKNERNRLLNELRKLKEDNDCLTYFLKYVEKSKK